MGIPVDYPLSRSINAEADYISKELSKSIYVLMRFSVANVVNICIDQRGTGLRSGEYFIPEEYKMNPSLVFRPNTGIRSRNETLINKEWQEFTGKIKDSLEMVFSNPIAGKTIHIFGDGQLGLAYFLGDFFVRSHNINLYVHNIRHKTCFSNEGQAFHTPITGGNANCEKEVFDDNGNPVSIHIDDASEYETVALFVGKENYLHDVKQHMQCRSKDIPLLFIESLRNNKKFENSDDVMDLVKKTVALIRRLKNSNKARTILFYCDLPFNVLVLLAANLENININIKYMEQRKDSDNINIKDGYEVLEMSSH